jgi:signal transduction histidine kinase
VAIKRTPLRQRLVVAFVLMTAAVSGLFSLVTFVAIEELEENLFVSQLDGDLRWWINHLGKTPQPQPLTLANRTRLYVTPDMPAGQVPPFLARQELGWHEVFDGHDTYHVVRRDHAGRRYYLVRQASELEHRERGWFAVLLAGTVVSVLAALLLARLIASSVLEPVGRLARRVRRADPARAPRRLATGFADDEIGELAHVFEQRLRQLQGFIASERLFTSDVSHELRTPAAIIAGAAETLLARSELLPRARSAVVRIHVAAQEMQDLIDAFLTLSRTPTAPPGQHPPCSVNAVVQAEVRRIRAQAAPGTPPIVVEEQAEPSLSCPATLLTVAVRNLLDNAVRYAPEGTVRITVRADAVVVEDGGTGLQESDIPRAFDRNRRLAPEVPGGEGLGLAIVQRICERSGWQVQVQVLPAGMRFELWFGGEDSQRQP